ncbi:acetylornithine deacetylase [Secundilactobacillus paracollinoides]|uniref:acetylornithine deacetylase n=1 Tax=Secundilactobacillus paracollinoides TaxID=240427 RepID=UPI00081A4759|nr:acetylornithine deacetylase [Secundilactobacillus paracollinoides]ANZ62650.1 acetylornithine deacetylase [Secundilactobacillus paracollinoides]
MSSLAKATEQALLQALEDHQDDLFEKLGQLVAFKTVSPTARNTTPLQEMITTQLETAVFDVKTQPFYDTDTLVSATLHGTDAKAHNSLLLNGHVDVATIADQDWQTDPFTMQRNGDLVIGRGVSDMKGAMACFLYLFDQLKALGVQLPGDLKFQSVVGEEAGEAGTKQLLEQGETVDFALVGDTSDLQLQGQGGVITGWVTLKSQKTYHDGNRVNMVAAGGGLKAASMVEKMVVVIQALQTLEHYWAVTKSYPGFPAGTDTINPSYIEGGIHPAFVADEARLWITVHFYPDENVDDITAEVEQQVLAAATADPWLRDNLPTFEWGGESMLVDKGEVFPSLELDEDSAAIQLLEVTHESQIGEAPTVTMSTSVADGGWFDYFGIPCVIYGPGTMSQAHTNDEQASFTQLLTYTKIIARFVWQWCHAEKPAKEN